MFKILMEILICLLAIYGAMALSFIVINSFFQKIKPEKSNLRLVLLVKDREEAIEGVVRGIFASNILKKIMSYGRLIVLDMGSTDETGKILNKLKYDYEQLEVFGIGEKEKIFHGFEENP